MAVRDAHFNPRAVLRARTTVRSLATFTAKAEEERKLRRKIGKACVFEDKTCEALACSGVR